MRPPPVEEQVAEHATPEQEGAPARRVVAAGLARLARWETLLVALLVGVVIYNAHLSPYFLDADNILDDTSTFMEIGMIALPMTLIIICGQIDLSVGSNAALCSVVFATLWQQGWNVWLACLAALAVGTAAGVFNGLLITRIRLPSLIVTLGTFALYRGLANGILGSGEISGFPDSFSGIDLRYLPGTHIPAPLVIFAVLAVLFGLLLHSTVIGRYIYAIGNNEQASRFSGVAVDRIVVILFGLSGLVSALAGLVLTSRLGTARSDLATGFELSAITAAVLGGANIFGGEGSIPGTVLALFIIGLLQNGLTLANISADVQTIVVGALLILSILLPGIAGRVRAALARRRGGESAAIQVTRQAL
jgi:rhamnose transport system permease protein